MSTRSRRRGLRGKYGGRDDIPPQRTPRLDVYPTDSYSVELPPVLPPSPLPQSPTSLPPQAYSRRTSTPTSENTDIDRQHIPLTLHVSPTGIYKHRLTDVSNIPPSQDMLRLRHPQTAHRPCSHLHLPPPSHRRIVTSDPKVFRISGTVVPPP